MQVIGFALSKVSAEKFPNVTGGSEIETNVEFKDITEEKLSILTDKDAIKADFLFRITYSSKESKKEKKNAEIIFEGHVLLSSEKEATKEIKKHWKKKELPDGFKIPLFNIILQRCTIKALQLEEELNLPTHFPLPKLAAKPKENKKQS